MIAAGEARAVKLPGLPAALVLAALLAGGCDTLARMDTIEGRHWQLVELVRGWRVADGRLELLDAEGAPPAVFDAGPRD
jgi:hypothetical protein